MHMFLTQASWTDYVSPEARENLTLYRDQAGFLCPFWLLVQMLNTSAGGGHRASNCLRSHLVSKVCFTYILLGQRWPRRQ